MRSRIRLFIIIFFFSITGLVLRLYFWQITYGQTLAKLGERQYQRSQSIISNRGSILANDESFLAVDSNNWLLFAMKPELKEDAKSIAYKLAPLLIKNPKDSEELKEKARLLEDSLNKDGVWIPLEHRVKNEVKINIEALKISGLGFDEEPSRSYPEGSSSANILGFVGKNDNGENVGYFGLEGYYDLTLQGKPGLIKRESDARGLPILFGNGKVIGSTGGFDLVTNIDKTVQFEIEKELKDGISAYGAKSGTATVMDPKNGAILAMASFPSFDPDKYWEYSDAEFKNSIISDVFEPGSIFKPLIMAAALDAKVVDKDTICDICDSPVKIDNYEIKTWNDVYYANSTMTDVIVHSDNVGMTFVGRKLGKDKLYDYLKNFGFGSLTGIDLQGEVASPLREKGRWSDIDAATATFGQGIAVTPIQILRAISVIANGGQLVKPQVVREIKNGNWKTEINPVIGPRVISEEAAMKVKDMMVKVVTDGESKWAAPKGFKIAGKTGTAQIPISGHYDPSKTIASFIGFAPVDNPKFAMLITLNEPSSSIWGAETAAPLWFNIAKDLFPYFGIQPQD